MLRVCEGNLLDASEDYIVQQCNCVSTKPHGLSRYIADRYPHGDVYAFIAPETRIPGTIATRGKIGERPIICAFAQFGVGKPGTYQNADFRLGQDSYDMRRDWFRSCLDHIFAEHNPRSVAFPYKIGCGLAGGHWEDVYPPVISVSRV